MRGRSRWLAAVVTGSATLGGAAAFASGSASSPASGAAAVIIPSPKDATTSRISSLVAQTQLLGAEITDARMELSRLEQQVATQAARRLAAQRSALQHVVAVAQVVSTAPATHTTTGASPSSDSGDSGTSGVTGDN
jgi:hypothetical protein